MEEDRAANQRSAFLLSFTLALYISNRFELSGINVGYKACFTVVRLPLFSNVFNMILITG